MSKNAKEKIMLINYNCILNNESISDYLKKYYNSKNVGISKDGICIINLYGKHYLEDIELEGFIKWMSKQSLFENLEETKTKLLYKDN